jgi:uncharacterized repeat protein (TIGR03803 family)
MRHVEITLESSSLFAAMIFIIFSASNLCLAQEQTLYGFGIAPDGNYPAVSLVLDRSGNLYGTTSQGGTSGVGTVFELAQSNGVWSETILYNFCQQSNCADGSAPYGKLVLDSKGNLYGTAYFGGTYGCGVAFRLTKNAMGTWNETIVHNFGNGLDGASPSAGMTFDKSGNLYGTTSFGGAAGSNCFGGCGTVFKLTPTGDGQWTEAVLYNFCSQPSCSDGNSPSAGVVFDNAGNLYGTTEYGGTLEVDGVVFELSPSGTGWTQQVLHTFAGGFDGDTPHGGVVVHGGNLYGTTEFGGKNGNNGTVYEVRHLRNGTWVEHVLHSFCAQFECSDGSSPLSEVTFDHSGNLYGTTFAGGTPQEGLVFKLSFSGGHAMESVVYSFTGATDGFNPHAGLVADRNGNLYGVTFQGGTGGYGTAFEITP